MRYFRVIPVFCLFVCLLERIHGVPFLYNSGKSILSSIFSSSGQSQDNGNIEDLRAIKISKADFTASDEPDNFDGFSTTSSPGQAIPGLIQKKIGKIFTKLQLFSILRNGLNPKPAGEDSFDNESFDADSENELELLVSSNNSFGPNNLNNTSAAQTSHVYRINGYLPPISQSSRFTLYPVDNATAPVNEADDGNKISLEGGSIGVYLMELFATLATLIYGAAIQVANVGSTTPQPNTIE